MALVASRYALRSTGRNPRRTALSVAGIGIGCALAIFASSFNRGREQLYARAVVDNGVGHLRVIPAGWRRTHDDRLRLAAGGGAGEVARAVPGVVAAGARARVQALLAMGSRVVAVEAVGVEPGPELGLDRTIGKLRGGRWLAPGDRGAAVVGQAVLDRLRAGVGDELLATAVGKGGAIESAMLTVVGVVATGSEERDASLCWTGLAEAAGLTGRAGPAEVTVRLRDAAGLPAARAALLARFPGDEVMSWEELTPDFKGHIEQDTAFSRLFTGIVLLVVLLGVGSAQLSAVLERRREIAVLSALGMGTGRMARLLAGEALLVGLAGAALGLCLSLPPLLRYTAAGIDLRSLMGSGWSFQGVVVEPIIYLDLGAWVVPQALLVSVGATLLATLWPAWLAARTDPAEALRSLP